MASIGKAIFANLSGNAGVTAITTTIVPSSAPKRDVYPQIVYESKDAEYDKGYSGNTGVVKQEVTVRCICKSSYTSDSQGYKQCDTLANAAIASLDNQTGVFGGITVQRFFLNDDTEDQFQDQESEEILYFVRELAIELWSNLD